MSEQNINWRSGAAWPAQIVAGAILCVVMAALALLVGDTWLWVSHRAHVLVAILGISCWRWSWFMLQNGRAAIYRYFVFPRFRKQAEAAIARLGPVPEVIILATTYHEKTYITEPVFTSIFRELSALKGLQRRPRVVVVTGCDQDDTNIREIYQRFISVRADQSPDLWPPELVLLRGDKGKRPALGTGMEEIARGNPLPDGVVVVLDGDTMLQPGLLEKVLPVFRLTPAVAGVTTNESGYVKGPAWFAEWTSLRFGLRHRSMCSVSLSGKLLCLTGRFSVFRASVAVDPSFRSQVERDIIEHWFWGRFEMLSGDDKSTWYWLSVHGHRMLYVPDAKVTTFEVVDGTGVERAVANTRRWSGNSVRHGWRAVMLGPRRLGFFAWWSLVDQRLTTFTVLFGPSAALLALANGRLEVVFGYLLWVLCSRSAHAAIACRHGRRVSAFYIPLTVISDWFAALTKLWVLFHPAKQKWLNRGGRTLNSTRSLTHYKLRNAFAHYLYVFSCAGLAMGVGLFVGLFPLFREAPLFLAPYAGPEVKAATTPEPGVARNVGDKNGEPMERVLTAAERPTMMR